MHIPAPRRCVLLVRMPWLHFQTTRSSHRIEKRRVFQDFYIFISPAPTQLFLSDLEDLKATYVGALFESLAYNDFLGSNCFFPDSEESR